MNIYDEILKRFVSDGHHRQMLLQPCKLGDYVYASDGIAIVRIPASLPTQDYTQEYEYYPVVETFFLKPQNTNEQIDLLAIQNWMASLPLKNIYANCEYCDGEGEINCEHCEHSHRCNDCSGSGDGKKIGQAPSISEVYNMDTVGYSYRNLLRILELNTIQSSDFRWVYKHVTEPNIFNWGEYIQIGIMPALLPDRDR